VSPAAAVHVTPVLDLLYGRIARARRAWYDRRPSARRRLDRPVISVGNLSVGGTGKTPLVAELARWLLSQGERPAILTRGYARRDRTAEPAVVADGTRVLLPVAAAGDEPLMLARAVPGAVVVVGASRYDAGRHAETALAATVHLLDDGFQHLPLARDLDIVVTAAGSLARDHVLPKGRLREPLDVLRQAAVLVVVGGDDQDAADEGARYGVATAVGARRVLGMPIGVGGGVPPVGASVVAVAGIGQPQQFEDGLMAAGWRVAETLRFADHHWYTAGDLAGIAAAVARHGAWGVLTTDKDAVRLEPLGPMPCPVARVPLTLEVPRWSAITAAVTDALARRRAGAGAVPGGA
jgi:tetraacyldisaccharide 4'-kinase